MKIETPTFLDPVPFGDDPACQRFLVLRYGRTDFTRGGNRSCFEFSESDADAVIEDFRTRGKDLVMDYDHATVKGGDAPASGWISALSKGADGLYADVKWTPKAVYPYGIWRCGVADEHRPEHLARDGRGYAFDHPIWTQSPPGGEFNCHCTRELCSKDDLERLGIRPEPLDSDFEPSSLGFDPSRGLQPPPLPKKATLEIAEAVERTVERDEQMPNSPANPETIPNITPGETTERQREKISDILRKKLAKFKEMLKKHGKGGNVDPGESLNIRGNHAADTESNGEEALIHDSVTKIDVKSKRFEKGIEAAQETIKDVFQIDKMPVVTEHREMTLSESETAEKKGRLGQCRKDTSRKDTYHILIRNNNPHPGITEIHETIHALILSGYITEKQTKRIFKAIQDTYTYRIYRRCMQEYYGEKTKNEWVTRALAWYAATHSKSEIIYKEAFDKYGTDGYGMEVWPEMEPEKSKEGQRRRKQPQELEAVIMKQIPFRGVFRKVKKLFGFTDEEELKRQQEEEARLEAEAKQRVQAAISPDLWDAMEEDLKHKNLTYKRIEELTASAGVTLQEVAEKFKQNIENRKLWAEHPELRPVYIL